jgi:hypothetical protein
MSEFCVEEYNEKNVSTSSTASSQIDVNLLNQICQKIEAMSKYHQVEILRILSANQGVTLNENKYGVHVNLSELPTSLIQELSKYIHYVQYLETSLVDQEKEKEACKQTFFDANANAK